MQETGCWVDDSRRGLILFFNTKVFEKLLFPISSMAYSEIESCLSKTDRDNPGKIKEILENFRGGFSSETQKTEWRPGDVKSVMYPSLNITICYNPELELKISTLRKEDDYKIMYDYNETNATEHPGNHLVIGFYRKSILHSFIVPVELILGFEAKKVTSEGSYQLYVHNIVPKDVRDLFSNKLEQSSTLAPQRPNYHDTKIFQKNSLTYIGITKRTWQQRFLEHTNAAQNGSNLLFHKALRGEFCEVAAYEHVIERAGLNEAQAMTIEEIEVENRSLCRLHKNGLNMIPGGRSGLNFIRYWANRTEYKIDTKELNPDTIESFLVKVQNHNLRNNRSSDFQENKNEKLTLLWAENIEFRIKAMTNQENRFSFSQIQAARMWYASGWSIDKIFQNLKKIENKDVSEEQIKNLLNGSTYASIPDVIL